MKVSLIVKNAGKGPLSWEITELQRAAQARGATVELVDITSVNQVAELAHTLGEIVIWRSATANRMSEKVAMVSQLAQGRVFLNEKIVEQPFLVDKLYQQRLIASRSDIRTIPTWHFLTRADLQQAIDQGQLIFPVIQKPRTGSRGQNITLLHSATDLVVTDATISDYIFQPYLANQGDFLFSFSRGLA